MLETRPTKSPWNPFPSISQALQPSQPCLSLRIAALRELLSELGQTCRQSRSLEPGKCQWSSCKKKAATNDVTLLEKKGPGAKAKEHNTQSPTCEMTWFLVQICWHFCLKAGEVILSWHHSDNSILQGKIQIWLCQKIRVTVLHLQHHWSKDIDLRILKGSVTTFQKEAIDLNRSNAVAQLSLGLWVHLQVDSYFCKWLLLSCFGVGISPAGRVIKKNSWHPTAWKIFHTHTKRRFQQCPESSTCPTSAWNFAAVSFPFIFTHCHLINFSLSDMIIAHEFVT